MSDSKLLQEAHTAIAMMRDNETAMQALRPVEQAHIRAMWQLLADVIFAGQRDGLKRSTVQDYGDAFRYFAEGL